MGFDLFQPFSNGEHTYASDGIMLIRVPRRDDIPEGGPRVSQRELTHWFDRVSECEWASLQEMQTGAEHLHPGTPATPCEDCAGTGRVVSCDECDGSGYTVCSGCGSDEKDCPKCKGKSCWPAKQGEDGIECDNCDGDGIEFHGSPDVTAVQTGPQWFDIARLARVSDLPNFEIATPMADPSDAESWSDPMLFRFEGGYGLLMPMRPPKAEQEEAA